MFRRILVALDGSPFAEAALPAALGLARRSNAEVRLVTVRDFGLPPPGELGASSRAGLTERAIQDEAQRYLEALGEELERSWPRISSILRLGEPAEEIVREADAFRADALVMATHSHGPLTRSWLGSVATECLHRANRPVLLVHPHARRDPERWDADVRRVVVPLDGSELAERALGPAIELANLHGCPITLLRAIHQLSVADPEFFPDRVATTDRLVTLDRSDAQAYLDEIARPLRDWGLEVGTSVAAGPSTAGAIVDEAGSDLLVMATHSRTGFRRAFLGSVAEAVVRAAPGPMLVIPPSPPEPRSRRLRAAEVELLEALVR